MSEHWSKVIKNSNEKYSWEQLFDKVEKMEADFKELRHVAEYYAIKENNLDGGAFARIQLESIGLKTAEVKS